MLSATHVVLKILREKHPENLPLSYPHLSENPDPPAQTTDHELRKVVSFPKGPAAGMGGMRPVFLKYLITVKGNAGKLL